jgi:tRNA threonylcarbamoyl adenosine modification protein (Sua5/YciO/YrdC/YwlC family)
VRLEINPNHPEPRKIARAVEILRKGGVIAYPTDTVYGLGCDIFQKRAIDRVYQIKGMRKDQPLALLVPDLSDIAKYAIVDNQTYRLLKRATPGPFCFILESTRDTPKILEMKRKQVGIRVPNNPIAQALVRELGNPIVSTSASHQGEMLNDPGEIDDRFPHLDLVLDAGLGGLEPSTVVDLTGPVPHVQREGAGKVEGLLI